MRSTVGANGARSIRTITFITLVKTSGLEVQPNGIAAHCRYRGGAPGGAPGGGGSAKVMNLRCSGWIATALYPSWRSNEIAQSPRRASRWSVFSVS